MTDRNKGERPQPICTSTEITQKYSTLSIQNSLQDYVLVALSDMLPSNPTIPGFWSQSPPPLAHCGITSLRPSLRGTVMCRGRMRWLTHRLSNWEMEVKMATLGDVEFIVAFYYHQSTEGRKWQNQVSQLLTQGMVWSQKTSSVHLRRPLLPTGGQPRTDCAEHHVSEQSRVTRSPNL